MLSGNRFPSLALVLLLSSSLVLAGLPATYGNTTIFSSIVPPAEGSTSNPCPTLTPLKVTGDNANGYSKSYTPSYAFDNNTKTFWSDYQSGAWIMADLGSAKKLCEVNVAWYSSGGQKYAFSISISNNTSGSFSTVYSGTSSGLTSSSAYDNYTIPNTDARYVKITVSGNTGGSSATIREIRISSPGPVDTVPPTITAPPNLTILSTGTLTIPSYLGSPTVSDNLDPNPAITNNAPSTGFPVGTTKVTWKATDASGNSASASQTITVISPLTKAGANPLTVSIIRDDLTDQSAVVSFFNKYSVSGDYYFNLHTMANTPDITSLKGTIMVYGTSSSSQLLTLANSLSAGYLILDEEPMNWNDFDNELQLAHSHGLKFAATPLYSDIQNNYAHLAKADMVMMQIPHFITIGKGVDSGLSYAQIVAKYSGLIRAQNPSMIVIEQYVTGPNNTNVDPSPIIAAYNSVKGVVDGFDLFYASTTDPLPIIEQFYNQTGIKPVN